MKVFLGSRCIDLPSHREKGRFLIHWRNRIVGHEVLFTRELPGDGLRVTTETTMSVPRLDLRQVATADYDRHLRPKRCVLMSEINQRRLALDLEIGDDRVRAITRLQRRAESKTIPLHREPLLLLEHCFALHALAGYVIGWRGNGAAAFTAVPVFEPLRIIPGNGERILMGGRSYPSPTLSIDLSPAVREHQWLGESWVERLVIPSAHLRAEWKQANRNGG